MALSREHKEMLRVGDAARLLGIHPITLRKWTDDGRVAVVRVNARGDRRYRRSDILALMDTSEASVDDPTRVVLYARVSGRGDQLTSLDHQLEELRLEAAEQGYEVTGEFTDVASVLNERRRGLTSMLDLVASGNVDVVLVTHADRLTRFGLPMIERLLTAHGARLQILHARVSSTPEQELVDDFMQLVASFAGRLYGQRSAAAKRRLIARAEAEAS